MSETLYTLREVAETYFTTVDAVRNRCKRQGIHLLDKWNPTTGRNVRAIRQTDIDSLGAFCNGSAEQIKMIQPTRQCILKLSSIPESGSVRYLRVGRVKKELYISIERSGRFIGTYILSEEERKLVCQALDKG